MRVIEITQAGEPEVLQIAERPIPQPKAGEVLIKVHAAGVNRPDVLQRQGRYPVPAGASDLPGLEVAGEIVGGELTDTNFRLGDLVCALVAGGGYAEYCVAPASHCLPIPKGWTAEEAATLPETFFTVWSNVFQRAGLQAQESLLVQGGTSGIGVTAIQLARALGHPVYATAGTDEKCAACVRLGATAAINYRNEDFSERILALTQGRGVDVILDMVAGNYIQKELTCLADDGRLVLIALLGGAKVELNAAQILMRRLTITGSTLRPRSIAFKAQIARDLKQNVWPLIEQGKIQAVIHQRFALEQAAQAHRLMERSEHIGKLVLIM